MSCELRAASCEPGDRGQKSLSAFVGLDRFPYRTPTIARMVVAQNTIIHFIKWPWTIS